MDRDVSGPFLDLMHGAARSLFESFALHSIGHLPGVPAPVQHIGYAAGYLKFVQTTENPRVAWDQQAQSSTTQPLAFHGLASAQHAVPTPRYGSLLCAARMRPLLRETIKAAMEDYRSTRRFYFETCDQRHRLLFPFQDYRVLER
jgi:hypothetical protein